MEISSLKIIIFIASGTSIIMGLYMLFLHNNARSVKGPLYWAVGNLVIGANLALRLIFFDSYFVVHFLYLMFSATGFYVYLAGIWCFKEKRIKRWLVIGFPVFDAIQIIIFFFVIPDNNIKMALHFLVLVVFSILSLYEMLWLDSEKKYLKKIFRLNAISFGVFLIILIGGLVLVMIHSNNQEHIKDAWIMAFGISGGIMTALTFGFLSAANLQLNSELEGQLKTKSKFLSIISHDLRSPVGTLMGFVDILNNRKDLAEEQKANVMDNLEILSRSTFHLLQNLLDWANTSGDIARFDEELIDLNQLIVSNIEFFQSLMLLKSIRLEFQHDEDVMIMGNPKMIETVIRNLVSNAIKFTPSEGVITITSKKNENKAHLTVADTGVGIEPKRMEQIFNIENIRTTNGTHGEGGSGLGLALCKDFVTKNHGTIKVESKVNNGSRFIVDFPLAR